MKTTGETMPETNKGETMQTQSEWSGSCDPCAPDNYWIDDVTGERVDAVTGERGQHQCPMLNADGSVKDD